MAPTAKPIWIHPADTGKPDSDTTTTVCSGCAPGENGPECGDVLGGSPCAAPRLSGPSDTLQRAMHSLKQVAVDADGGRNIVDLQLVKALRIDDGEAELTVSFPLRCGSARQLADGAFQALRHLLPDTDIYVRHAA
jgi:metal-sulfur cluster biosynthetic enzyme